MGKSVVLQGFEIGKDEFETVVDIFHSTEEVNFTQCKINSKNIKFSKRTKFKIKTLGFYQTGDEAHSDWKGDNWVFDDILRAIKKCSLKKSLKILISQGNQYPSEEIHNCLVDFNLNMDLVHRSEVDEDVDKNELQNLSQESNLEMVGWLLENFRRL